MKVVGTLLSVDKAKISHGTEEMDAVARRWKESLLPEWCMTKSSISCRSLASKAFARTEAATRPNSLEGICTQPTLPGQQAQLVFGALRQVALQLPSQATA